jgi:hypothetical protein
MQYAIVENGKIVATNAKMVVVSDLAVYVDSPEPAEGKVLDKNLLRWMAKKDFKRLECTATGITAYYSRGEKEEMPWSGYYRTEEKASRAMYLYANGENLIGNFPHWPSVIPDDSQYAESDGIRQTGLDADLLATAIACFAFGSQEKILKFEFCGNDKIIRITLPGEWGNDFMQAVYLMPRAV